MEKRYKSMDWKELYEKTEWLCNGLFGYGRKGSDDKDLQELLARLEGNGYLLKKMEEQESYDYRKAFRRLPRKQRRLNTLFRMTAVMLLLLTAGTVTYRFYRNDKEGCSLPYRQEDVWNGIVPGGHRAMLVKSDGEKVSLEKRPFAIQEKDSLQIQVDSSGLHYETITEKVPDIPMQHTLLVPKGGEYYLVLADGTQVWLNADSELRYPVTFTGSTREVEVKGEVYFKVSKDKDRPFLVRTAEGSIRVWGTEFNVQAYPESGRTVTTLVEGKVSYHFRQGGEVFMAPSQELTVTSDGQRDLRTVDTRYAGSWKDGLFLFQEENLEDLLHRLGKWYDLKVRFKDEAAKRLHFSGDLSRYRNIGTFINMFEQCSDASFSLEDGVLTVGLKN